LVTTKGKPGPKGELTPKNAMFLASLIDPKSPTYQDREASMLAAGYGGNKHSRSVTASNIIKKPAAQKALAKALEKYDIDKVVQRLAEHAEGDIGDFITVNEDGSFAFDLVKARAAKKTHLIKKLKHDAESGAPVIELHDPQAALDKIARMHKAYGKDEEEQGGHDMAPVRVQILQVLSSDPEARRMVDALAVKSLPVDTER
jgi:hypothetical protein